MTSSEQPAPSSPTPSRWIRTLPWLAGLLIGASAHIVWWTSVRHQPEPEVRVIAVPSAPVHVIVHDGRVAPPMAKARPRGHECRKQRDREARHERRRAKSGAAGAMVCNDRGCRIRRSFVGEALREPSLLGPPVQLSEVRDARGAARLRIDGVVPGSVPDLLGLRSQDVIVSVGGDPIETLPTLAAAANRLGRSGRGFTIVVEREGQRHALRHRLI